MVKINSLELENIKRIKAVSLIPGENGLTVIGGKNGQGKTSVLDAIAWALGGEKFRPSQAQRDGSVLPPKLRVTLSNGLVVERSGKNGSLKVTDPNGGKGGQQLLNEFVEALALDLPKFMGASQKEKADILLRVIGVGEQLAVLDQKAAEIYNNRRAIGQIADQKGKFAAEMPEYPDVPMEPVSVSELIAKQQEILARNGQNQKLRQQHEELERLCGELGQKAVRLQVELDEVNRQLNKAQLDFLTSSKTVKELQDESTAELEESIRSVDDLNRRVRANLDKEKAEEEANAYQKQYDQLSRDLDAVRQERKDLLEGAALPLPGLSVEDGQLSYEGKNWDSLSGSDQLKVSTAIVRAVNPKCGFVLIDKLEQMDSETMAEFGAWLEKEGLQVIATRVSTGDECSVIIEDGMVAEMKAPPAPPAAPPWNGGNR